MNNHMVGISLSRFLLGLFVIMASLGASIVVLAQQTKTEKRIRGSVLEVGGFMEIPHATEPCNQSECEWFRQLREAGNRAQRNRNEKSTKKYMLLLVEGLQKSYRVPLADRPPQKLVDGPSPLPGNFWRAMRDGTVELSVETRADGSVGDVIVVQGLNKDLDQLSVSEIRQSIFLPAVRDRVFVTDWLKTRRTFFVAPGAAARGLRPD
jgi:hypothetical protein